MRLRAPGGVRVPCMTRLETPHKAGEKFPKKGELPEFAAFRAENCRTSAAFRTEQLTTRVKYQFGTAFPAEDFLFESAAVFYDHYSKYVSSAT